MAGEMKHTPGPWEYAADKRDTMRVFAGDGEIVRALSTHGHRRLSKAEREANARLIAAAPDLLEFVEQIFNGLDTGMVKVDSPADETLENVLSRGRAAVSRAKGGTE